MEPYIVSLNYSFISKRMEKIELMNHGLNCYFVMIIFDMSLEKEARDSKF